MNHSIESSGKSIDEAIQSALRTLGTDRDSVTVEVLEKPKTGFLGIGSTPARVRVTLLADELAEEEPKPAPARKPAPTPKPAPARKPAPEPKPAPVAPSPKKAPEAAATAPSKPPKPAPATQGTERRERGGERNRSRYDMPQEPVSEERVAAVRAYLEETLVKMGIENAHVKTSQEERYLLLEVSGENMGQLIGRRGETLDAVQRLVSHAINHGAERHIRIVVDTEQYRQKREESLVALAQKSAERALRQRRNVPLEPMNSYARHVIHTALQDFAGVSTHSVGSEPNRRVIISVAGGDTRPPRGGLRHTGR